MRASRPLLALASMYILVLVAGCSSTKISSVWMDTEVVPPTFQKVVVIVMGRDQNLRRLAEDTFVHSLPRKVQGVPSYTLFSGEVMPELSEVRARVNEVGADGVVVYRLVAVEKTGSYMPGVAYATPYPYYGTFGAYWGYAAPVVYESGYRVEDQVVRVESNAYSVADERLVWTAQSETLNPGSAELLIDDVIVATMKRLREDKLLP